MLLEAKEKSEKIKKETLKIGRSKIEKITREVYKRRL